MDKEQIKEAILGKPDCSKEETPLCEFATFHPDMEMVKILLKGADIDISIKIYISNCWHFFTHSIFFIGIFNRQCHICIIIQSDFPS